jgi:hypothetical protein
VGIKLVQPLWKTIWRLLKKVKIRQEKENKKPECGLCAYCTNTVNLNWLEATMRRGLGSSEEV